MRKDSDISTIVCGSKSCTYTFPASRTVQNKPRKACPACGSIARKIIMQPMTAVLSGQASMKGVAFTTSKSKYFAKFWDKVETYKQNGRLQSVVRSLNKRTDRYDEVITYKATREIPREVHEPLSEHINRGSARRDRSS